MSTLEKHNHLQVDSLSPPEQPRSIPKALAFTTAAIILESWAVVFFQPKWLRLSIIMTALAVFLIYRTLHSLCIQHRCITFLDRLLYSHRKFSGAVLLYISFNWTLICIWSLMSSVILMLENWPRVNDGGFVYSSLVIGLWRTWLVVIAVVSSGTLGWAFCTMVYAFRTSIYAPSEKVKASTPAAKSTQTR